MKFNLKNQPRGCGAKDWEEWAEGFEKELRMKYLHGKVVEKKGWVAETAERKMCKEILGE